VTTFTATSGALSTPLTEGIESATFPPTGWILTNPDGGKTWARTTAAKKTGTASMWMDNINYTTNGEVDYLTSTPINLSMVTNPALSFQVAYQLLTNPTANPNWSDTLNVQISTDCGVTPLHRLTVQTHLCLQLLSGDLKQFHCHLMLLQQMH
jgi:hypothetical protein